MDPTSVTPEKIPDPTSVVPEKHRDLTRLNKSISDPTSKRRSNRDPNDPRANHKTTINRIILLRNGHNNIIMGTTRSHNNYR